MNPDADRLLEADRIEPLLEAPESAQSVVVIQYRTKGPSWIVVVALIFLVPLVGIWVYHRQVVARIRAEAVVTARHEMERRVARNPAGGAVAAQAEIEEAATTKPPAAVPAAPPGPLALNSRPMAEAGAGPIGDGGRIIVNPSESMGSASSPSAVASGATPLPASAGSSAGDSRPRPAKTTAPGTAPAAVAAPGTAGPRRDPAPSDVPPPPQPVPPVAAIVLPPPSPVAVAGPEPTGDRLRPNRSAGPSTGDLPAVFGPLTRVSTPPGTNDLDPASARGGGRAGGVPASEAAPPGPDLGVGASPRAAPDIEAPLPSKEETLRAIQEEAARKQAEIHLQEEVKQADRRRIQDDERRKFRDELRQVLRSTRQPGPAIDELCARYGYQFDSETFARARRAWIASTRPVATKVRMARAFDLPEPQILNFLSDDLHGQLRSRNGPRDSNQVRIRAARTLLSCELPESDGEPTAPAAAPTAGDAPTPGRAAGVAPAGATAARPR